MNNELWIYPELKGRGYSTVRVFEDEHVYVSIGSTCGSVDHDREPIIIIRFNHGDFSIVCGQKEIDEFKATKDKSFWAFRTLLNHLTPEWFQYLLQVQRERGQREGRNEMRRRFKFLLAEE